MGTVFCVIKIASIDGRKWFIRHIASFCLMDNWYGRSDGLILPGSAPTLLGPLRYKKIEIIASPLEKGRLLD